MAALAAYYAPISKRSIRPEHFRAVITHIAHSGHPDAARIAEYLELLAATGVPPRQIEQMTLEHMSCGNSRILVPHERSARTRTQIIAADAAQIVSRIALGAKNRGTGIFDRVFPEMIHKAANGAIAAACAALGIERFTCSTVRRFHADSEQERLSSRQNGIQQPFPAPE